jgi:NOL1/NOP2/fmu family ribosome biogenesis protein
MRARFLTRKEMREINDKLEEQHGCSFDIDSYHYMETAKGDLNMISRDIERIDYNNINEVSAGLYVADIKGQLRLSLEGTQLLGKYATKNVIELDDDEWERWLKRESISSERFNEFEKGYYIIKNEDDYFGCGFLDDGLLKTFVPKSRSLQTVH